MKLHASIQLSALAHALLLLQAQLTSVPCYHACTAAGRGPHGTQAVLSGGARVSYITGD
jgi:hypothetical protein